MGSTVAVGGMEISSNSESAQDMVRVLKPIKEDKTEPKVLVDEGKVLDEPEAEADPLSKAAAELGKKGGEAAAKARAEREKEAKPEPKAEPEKEAKAEEKPAEESEEKPSRAKARIETLARERAEERRAREAAEAKAAALEARLERLEAAARGEAPKAPEKAEAKSAGNGKPAPDQFETYEDYIEAFTDWKAERILERQTQQARQSAEVEAHVQRQKATVDGFNQRIAKAKESDPEVMERIDPRFYELQPTFTLPPGSQVGPANDIAQAIIESEHGVSLMVYLTEHPDVMEGLLRLPDSWAVTRAVGRLEAKVAEMPPPAPKGVSKAPPPVRPVASSAVVGEPDVLGDMDFDTFYRRAQSRRR